MRMTPSLLGPTLIGLAGLAACTTAPTPSQQSAMDARDARYEAELAEALEGYVAGEPTDCLPTGFQQSRASSTMIGNRTILYRLNANTIYRNDPPGGCGGAGLNTALVTQTPVGRSCRGDILQVIDPVNRINVGGCSLGTFTPYTRVREGG